MTTKSQIPPASSRLLLIAVSTCTAIALGVAALITVNRSASESTAPAASAVVAPVQHAAPVALASARAAEPVPAAVYIVASEDRANWVHNMMTDANDLRYTQGVAPIQYRILIIQSEDEAREMHRALEDEQRLLNGLLRPQLQIYDLRSQDSQP